MPSGVLMGGIALAGGLYLGVLAAREFAEGGRDWKKRLVAILAMLIAGGALTGLGIM
jgi:membrane-associated phospholipid phosphatase